ncbi:hypothetical protein C4D60_Mb11t06290 [Musa balbisiana]|uniref:Transcription initiation factor TFIID subunit 8 n=1 Tax=Musa balbisiana TaxID=52838 RepID=A0A4S8J3M3_MUSBA|nr:hypothetical protein C4D60_Mb11t06290 [Musa balbisiana]
MSDGRKNSERGQQISSKKSRLSGGDDFGHAIAKIAVAQLCESTGFHYSRRSAIDALAEVAVRYICDLGKSAIFYANLAGRTDCNVFDIIQGIQDLDSWRGFSGASGVHRCLVNTGVVREITQFVSTKEEIPFVQPIPRFPISRMPKPAPSFVQAGEEPPGEHIPNWLPRLPDPHTYVHTPVWNKRDTDVKADMVELAKRRRKAERSLLSLQQRLACNSTAGFHPTKDGHVGNGNQVINNNPFLASPLPYGEKEVSEIASPLKAYAGKRLSVLETFVPVIKAAKVGSLDFNTNERKLLHGIRPTVHFKVGTVKKSVAASLPSDTLIADEDSWSLKYDEKDDKKKRAEIIFRAVIDKPHELAQL